MNNRKNIIRFYRPDMPCFELSNFYRSPFLAVLPGEEKGVRSPDSAALHPGYDHPVARMKHQRNAGKEGGTELPDSATIHQWPTVEHYFQAAKFTAPDLQEQVRQAPTPRMAKTLGRNLAPLRPDWEQIKESVMLTALRAKFRQPELCRLLLATGHARLEEASPTDAYWGTGPDGKGRNRLGILLMQVREELRHADPPPGSYEP